MPHPKHRFSQTRTAKRRTHDKVEAAQLITCSNCGAQVMYHHVCPECGYTETYIEDTTDIKKLIDKR